MRIALPAASAVFASVSLTLAIVGESRADAPSGAPSALSAHPTAAVSSGPALPILTGAVTITLKSGAAKGTRVLESVSGRYEVRGRGEGFVTFGGSAVPATLVVSAAGDFRRGTWERNAGSDAVGRSRLVRFTANGGAPPSRIELVRDGKLVGTIVTGWVREEGGWRMAHRVVTAYDHGRRARELELSTGAVTAAAVGPVAANAAATAGRPADECLSLLNQLWDALDRLRVAEDGLSSCLAGPYPCAFAAVAFYSAWNSASAAEGSAGPCLRAS